MLQGSLSRSLVLVQVRRGAIDSVASIAFFHKLVAQAVLAQARAAGQSVVPHVDYERPLTYANMVQVSARSTAACGGKAPPVLAEYMSTTSLSICPAIAAQLLPKLRKVFLFSWRTKGLHLKACGGIVFLYHSYCRPLVIQGVLRMGAANFAAVFSCDPWYPFFLERMFENTYSSRLQIRCTLEGFLVTRNGQVLGESSFANPFKLRDCFKIVECLCSSRHHLPCRSDFPLGLGALSGKRLACHCAMADRCAEFAHFHGATSGPFIAVSATPWTPHAFLEAARLLPHPFQDVALDANILQLCLHCVTKGSDFVMAQRLNFVKRWTARAQQLGAAEIKFHKSLHTTVEKVVQFLVLLEMLRELGFRKYRTLVQLMYTGFPLLGQLEMMMTMMMTLKEVRPTVVRRPGLTGVSVGVITPRKKSVRTGAACSVGKTCTYTRLK